ncbi:MAG: bifunctional diaminohydroxyphosphoribosylaminopyrimidine deaminase/5-amino-6-(5-phosphoribosylamino)uracil reductase RibD [Pseudomonadota bacterium]
MSRSGDERWMALAVSLGRRHLGQTWPNPSVGCVIIKEERLVGQGVTAIGGRPHAEPQALAMAGAEAKGATAYVTLEPCAHHGNTPPCVDALIAAEVGRVVIGLMDPDPRTDGSSVEKLRAAGIAVETDVLNAEASELHAGFVTKILKNRPFVTLKLATSLDGKIATGSGDSQWITGPDARRFTHLLRAQNDAIMVGRGTVVSDDPALTVRLAGLGAKSPVRVVLSSTGNIPHQAQLLADGAVPTWVLHGGDQSLDGHASHVTAVPIGTSPDGTLDMHAVLTGLAERGITTLFCEGGSQIAASLLRENLVDRLILFTGGKIIGSGGLPSIGDMQSEVLKALPDARLDWVRPIGPDTCAQYTMISAKTDHN